MSDRNEIFARLARLESRMASAEKQEDAHEFRVVELVDGCQIRLQVLEIALGLTVIAGQGGNSILDRLEALDKRMVAQEQRPAAIVTPVENTVYFWLEQRINESSGAKISDDMLAHIVRVVEILTCKPVVRVDGKWRIKR